MNLAALHRAVRDSIRSGTPSPAAPGIGRMSSVERAALRAWGRTSRRTGRGANLLLRPSNGLLLIWMVASTRQAAE